MAKQNINITLKVGEIEYEVKDKSYLVGQAVDAAGGSVKASASVQVTDDAERHNLLTRFIGNGIARLKQLLSEWIGSGSLNGNNVLGVNDTVTLTLRMPTNFATSATDDIAASCHRYITDYALGAWFELMAPDKAAMYHQSAAEQASLLMLAVYRRQRPVRRGHSNNSGDPSGDTTTNVWHNSNVWHNANIWYNGSLTH